MIQTAVERKGDFVDLSHYHRVRIGNVVLRVGTESYRTHNAFDRGALQCDDVEDGARALGVLACSGIGDYLDFLDCGSRDGLENILGIFGEVVVGASVFINLEIGRAVYFDCAVGVDRDHGHLAQNLLYGRCLGLIIGLNVVANAVNLL